jgi:hypothetical protein
MKKTDQRTGKGHSESEGAAIIYTALKGPWFGDINI